MIELEKDLSRIYIRKLQLDERHRTIMEAWDEKSKSKTNRKLAQMYSDLHDELKELERVQLILEKEKHEYNVDWNKYSKILT